MNQNYNRQPPRPGDKKNNKGLIIGIVIAGIVILAGLILAAIVAVVAYFGVKNVAEDSSGAAVVEDYDGNEAETDTKNDTKNDTETNASAEPDETAEAASDTQETPEIAAEQPEDDGYVIFDYKFDDGNELGYWVDNTSKGTAYVSGEAMCLTAQNFGENSWDIGLASADFAITKGNTYTISFDAYSNYTNLIYFGLKQNYESWYAYMETTFKAEPTWNHYEYTYVASDTDFPCNIVFFLGGTGSEMYDQYGDITFMVDNIKITEK